MENPTTLVIKQICSYFLEPPLPLPLPTATAGSATASCVVVPTPSRPSKQKNGSSLVRVHFERLSDLGEFSFPRSSDIWRNYFAKAGRRPREQSFAMFADDKTDQQAQQARVAFLAAAASWRTPVMRLQVTNERCVLFLQRSAVIDQVLRQVFNTGSGYVRYGQLRKQPQRRLHLCETVEENAEKLSHYRARLVRETLRRVLEYSAWSLVSSEEEAAAADADVDARREDAVAAALAAPQALQLQVRSIAAKTAAEKEAGVVSIKCGIVTDSYKLAKLSTQEYLDIRSNDMRLMAMHKYGIRALDDQQFCALMKRLGAAAVTVDLLEVKHSSPVQIIRNAQGSTKGASFILYNSARLETLLRSFDERVRQSDYGQLPALDNVDLNLLKEEEEWQLIFGYIFAFPNLIERCLEQLEQGACATHLIVRFLSGFTAIFSVYYRRIRILTDMRIHLMPLVYARVYLIKAVREILNQTLALLDIEPVEFM